MPLGLTRLLWKRLLTASKILDTQANASIRDRVPQELSRITSFWLHNRTLGKELSMRSHVARTFLAALIALLLTLSALGQEAAPTDESLIKQVRSNIQREIENAPAPGAADEEIYRTTLTSLRRQLQKLLWKKTGAPELRINNLKDPGALPEVIAHADQLQQELDRINGELQELDHALEGTVASGPPPSSPQQPQQPQTRTVTPPVKTTAELKFESDVAGITRDDLAGAAVPAAVAESPAPTCNQNGRP